MRKFIQKPYSLHVMNRLLDNHSVRDLVWSGVTISVSDRTVKGLKSVVHNVGGNVDAGEILAIVGPSGSGKTTLLNALAHRSTLSSTDINSQILLNQQRPTATHFRRLSRFVETEDVLIGALTVRETLYFAAQLGLGSGVSHGERDKLIEEMLRVFGLTDQAEMIVGTLVKRGISTGQKRRLSIAAQLISAPKILFLDEPTSGLDSSASFKVVSYLKDVTKAHNLLVICSVHQPSSATFDLFDKVSVMSGGKTCYFGKVGDLRTHMSAIGHPIPLYTNPAEFVLDLINIDFETDIESSHLILSKIHRSWESIELGRTAKELLSGRGAPGSLALKDIMGDSLQNSSCDLAFTVMHRNWIKSKRDFMVYGARLAMYLGLAILMGTVWLRLPPAQTSVEPFAHCILFGSTFMSFMAVVYVPAFVEDHSVFVKDRNNGLYGSAAFMISNFLVGIPYLFILALVPSTFTYWMVNFRPTATAFMIWVLWAYLNLLAAESLVVLVSAIFPNFIGSLAAFAMLNGVFMACNGFMVPRAQLNVFYRFVFYYINYQGYVFRGLSVNEFAYREYGCGRECDCRIATSVAGDCKIAGSSVLQSLQIDGDEQAVLVGIMVGIIVGIRVLGWIALKWR